MRKGFIIFLLFVTVIMTSCGHIFDENKNTVRFTLPGGNARSITASGANDVSYYNVYIEGQSFTHVQPGATIESYHFPVGTKVSVSVEAIGKINDESGTTVVSNSRIAYYQTTQYMQSGGITINVNLNKYKTVYHKVTFDLNNFPASISSIPAIYVQNGQPVILPKIETDNNFLTNPPVHKGWNYSGGFISAGGSVIITKDTNFTLEKDNI